MSPDPAHHTTAGTATARTTVYAAATAEENGMILDGRLGGLKHKQAHDGSNDWVNDGGDSERRSGTCEEHRHQAAVRLGRGLAVGALGFHGESSSMPRRDNAKPPIRPVVSRGVCAIAHTARTILGTQEQKARRSGRLCLPPCQTGVTRPSPSSRERSELFDDGRQDEVERE